MHVAETSAQNEGNVRASCVMFHPPHCLERARVRQKVTHSLHLATLSSVGALCGRSPAQKWWLTPGWGLADVAQRQLIHVFTIFSNARYALATHYISLLNAPAAHRN